MGKVQNIRTRYTCFVFELIIHLHIFGSFSKYCTKTCFPKRRHHHHDQQHKKIKINETIYSTRARDSKENRTQFIPWWSVNLLLNLTWTDQAQQHSLHQSNSMTWMKINELEQLYRNKAEKRHSGVLPFSLPYPQLLIGILCFQDVRFESWDRVHTTWSRMSRGSLW